MRAAIPILLVASACGRAPSRPPSPGEELGGPTADAGPAEVAIAAAAIDAAVAVDAPVDAAIDAAVPAPPGWTDVTAAIPDVVLDLRYATAHNLTGAPLYPVARCLLRTAVAERLARAADQLRPQGHRLLMWDCYRPASIQRELWARVPDTRYVARPRFDGAGKPIGGSKHSRGAAVDLSLADPAGAPRAMPTDHDDFTPAARGDAATGAAARHLADLRTAMTSVGFAPMPTEWWHFDASDWASYPLADEPLR